MSKNSLGHCIFKFVCVYLEFKALLVGKNMRSGVSTRGVAWGRFYVEKNTLRFSITYSR